MTAQSQPSPPRRWPGVLLWVLAVALMMATAVYQRRTGPTNPLRGEVALAGQTIAYKLLRSENTGTDAPVSIPIPGPEVTGTLEWRRYTTNEDFTAIPMVHEGVELAARLPTQPPAGKVEYRVKLQNEAASATIPAQGTVVLRYKGVVPAAALVPHILFMFFGVVFGFRVVLEILARRPGVRWMSWTTLTLMGLGGMLFGPIVQHYAFGEAWTGVPFGWDLTDNKTLVMFICWVVACATLGLKGPVSVRARRITLAAAFVMLLVYLVPHSMFGSTLNYEQVDQGVDPAEAIGQG